MALIELSELGGRIFAPSDFGPRIRIAEAHLSDVFNDVLFIAIGEVCGLRLHDALGNGAVQHLRRHQFQPGGMGRFVDLRFVAPRTIFDVELLPREGVTITQITYPSVLFVHRAQSRGLGLSRRDICRRRDVLFGSASHQCHQGDNARSGDEAFPHIKYHRCHLLFVVLKMIMAWE